MAVCYIVGAGDCPPLDNIRINEGDTVIAADAGLRYLRAAGINPDSVIGDFDSLGSVPEGGKVTVLPAEKDVTDMYATPSSNSTAGRADASTIPLPIFSSALLSSREATGLISLPRSKY